MSNDNTVLSDIEMNITPAFFGSVVKVNGRHIRRVRSVLLSANLNDVPTATIEVIGRIDAKIRGAVNIIETVHYDSEGKEIKIGEKERL